MRVQARGSGLCVLKRKRGGFHRRSRIRCSSITTAVFERGCVAGLNLGLILGAEGRQLRTEPSICQFCPHFHYSQPLK
jgi:hypothetical protein